jgi:predicted nucleic acid-binding protein
MVPAFALRHPEHAFYANAIRKCWKFVFSEPILEEYQRVMKKFGFPGYVVALELQKLCAMKKCRMSRADHNIISEDLAPRKDKHIVAACQDIANVLVSSDRGILECKETIEQRLRVEVLSLEMATRKLDRSADCPPGRD